MDSKVGGSDYVNSNIGSIRVDDLNLKKKKIWIKDRCQV